MNLPLAIITSSAAVHAAYTLYGLRGWRLGLVIAYIGSFLAFGLLPYSSPVSFTWVGLISSLRQPV